MMTPTEAQLTAIAAAFDTFARKFKLAEALSTNRPLIEIDKQTLFYIAEHPGCGPTDVARFLNVPATTLTSVADRLVKARLIERGRAEQDRRAVALSLTDSGLAQVSALTRVQHEMYCRLLQPLSRTDQNELIRLITNAAQNEN